MFARSLCLLVVGTIAAAAACAATSIGKPTSEDTEIPAIRLPDLEPKAREENSASEAASATDTCSQKPRVLSKPLVGASSLSDVLAQTELVGIGIVTVDEADCSGIGWHHLAFTLALSTDEVLEVYRRVPLQGLGPGVKTLAVVGAKRVPSQRKNLMGVCVEFDREVQGEIEWLLPLDTVDEADIWRARLAEGVCGRPPA